MPHGWPELAHKHFHSHHQSSSPEQLTRQDCRELFALTTGLNWPIKLARFRIICCSISQTGLAGWLFRTHRWSKLAHDEEGVHARVVQYDANRGVGRDDIPTSRLAYNQYCGLYACIQSKQQA